MAQPSWSGTDRKPTVLSLVLNGLTFPGQRQSYRCADSRAHSDAVAPKLGRRRRDDLHDERCARRAPFKKPWIGADEKHPCAAHYNMRQGKTTTRGAGERNLLRPALLTSGPALTEFRNSGSCCTHRKEPGSR